MASKSAVAARAFVLAMVALLSAATVLPRAAAQEGNFVTATRVVGDETRTRFIADLDEAVPIRVFALADPYRIVIDLPNVHFQLDPGTGQTGFALISAYRFGVIWQGQSRIVLDVTEPVEVAYYNVIPAVEGQPARLVVDLAPTTRDAFLANALEYNPNGTRPEIPDTPIGDNVNDGRLVVVIDPGHGGIDAGATSPVLHLAEKDIVLAFALELAAQLRATGRYEVVLTREDDTLIALADRVALARAAGADILLSIHANAYTPSTAVRGAVVFTLADTPSTRFAADLAAHENRADILAGIDIAATDDAVVDILLDMARTETQRLSVILARGIVDALRSDVALIDPPHQRDNFAVLRAPDVPSVLVELGFMTNPDDERLLQSPDWRRETAASLVTAIEGFFDTRIAGVLP